MSKYNPNATIVDLKLAIVRWYETEGRDRVAIKQMLIEIAADLGAPADMVQEIEALPTENGPGA